MIRMPPKRKLTVDPVALNRLSAVEETGTEHFERDLGHDEETASFLRRIDFGQTVEADAEKESEPVKEWPWQGLCENLVEAQGELNIIMDLVDTVKANFDIDVAMLHRPRRLPNEELSDKAISLSVKLLSFNVASQILHWLHEEVKVYKEKVSRDFLRLSFEVGKSRTITLVANIDVKEYNINWLLVVKDISGTGLESKLLGSLKLENLYDIVLDLVHLDVGGA